MQAGDIALGRVFANDHQNVVPVFQRPYVWDETDNWVPLWSDLLRAAEHLETEMASSDETHSSPTYFLGAVVVQQRHNHPQRVDSSHIIDGQQRLTTIQVVLAACRNAATLLAEDKTAARFSALIENRSDTIHEDFPQDRYKVWPLPQDKSAYLWAVRRPGEEVTPPDPTHRLVRAREWFDAKVSTWAAESTEPRQRLEALLYAMRDRIQVVQINLEPADDPQVIFEALNHRGVRLAAADLVKNLLFQTVEKQGEGADAELLLTDFWLPLDGKFWRAEITTGRIKRALVDLLLSFWLAIRSLDDVVVDHLFADFKQWMSDTESIGADVIRDLRHHADVYQKLVAFPRSDPTGRTIENMAATGTTTPWPVILYLHANPEVPETQKHRAAEAIDSFLMRRGVAGLTSSDYNRLFLQVLKQTTEADPEVAGDAVVSCLLSQSAESRIWPTDDQFRAALLGPGVYSGMYRARLKTLLVGVENHLRTSGMTVGGDTLDPKSRTLNVEHVLPQRWELNWPLGQEATEEDQQVRLDAVHRLGNLTLATKRLNSSLSNRPWVDKRPILQEYSLVRITTASVLAAPSPQGDSYSDESWSAEWDEERIARRGEWLADRAMEIWQRPIGA